MEWIANLTYDQLLYFEKEKERIEHNTNIYGVVL